uniref:serine/arginine-rich splicing factor 3 isoform X2 n=1 Tax=Myxine glutinosa TaxID=7769 RepID=UPI0035902BCD
MHSGVGAPFCEIREPFIEVSRESSNFIACLVHLSSVGEMSADCPLDCKVYVGNLGNSGNKADLEQSFSYYGPLRNVWVARNPPGFAFVEFEDPRDAADAVREMDGRTLCGCRVRVELSNGEKRSRFRGGQQQFARRPRYEDFRRRSPMISRRRSRSPRRRSVSRSRSRSIPREARRRSYSKERVRNRSPSFSRSRRSIDQLSCHMPPPQREQEESGDNRSRSADK